jgi:hypothetical protein
MTVEDVERTRHAKVTFRGDDYWLTDGVLAPLEHFDEAGELLANPFRERFLRGDRGLQDPALWGRTRHSG